MNLDPLFQYRVTMISPSTKTARQLKKFTKCDRNRTQNRYAIKCFPNKPPGIEPQNR
jgi:hypothetical protein